MKCDVYPSSGSKNLWIAAYFDTAAKLSNRKLSNILAMPRSGSPTEGQYLCYLYDKNQKTSPPHSIFKKSRT